MPVERAALLGSRGWAAEETIRTARRPRQGAPRRRAVTRPPTSFGHQTTSAASRPLRLARNGLAIATISPHWIAEGTPAETRGCTESTASTADASQTRLDLSTVLQTCQCPPSPPHRVIPPSSWHPIAHTTTHHRYVPRWFGHLALPSWHFRRHQLVVRLRLVELPLGQSCVIAETIKLLLMRWQHFVVLPSGILHDVLTQVQLDHRRRARAGGGPARVEPQGSPARPAAHGTRAGGNNTFRPVLL